MTREEYEEMLHELDSFRRVYPLEQDLRVWKQFQELCEVVKTRMEDAT